MAASAVYIQFLMNFQATAVMPEFWRSLLRQSKPSTLTLAGLRPNFTRAPPAFIADGDMDGDAELEGDTSCSVDKGDSFSSPKLASCTNGLETLEGGVPQKNGGDDAISFDDRSSP